MLNKGREVRPLASVIIPCFNAGRFVVDAIESALAQTYRPLEVIVVDDGSSDDSLRRIRSYSGRVRVFSQEHRGAAAARNAGLHAARGRIIQFLDADDLLDRDKIARQVPLLEQEEAVVFCDYRIDARPGAKARVPQRRPYQGGDPLIYMLDSHIAMMTALYPRIWLERVGGFDEGLPCALEYDLNLRIAAYGARFVRLPETLAVWRQVPGSLSSDEVRVLRQYPRILDRIHSILLQNGTLNEERRKALACTLARAGRHLIRRGAPEAGVDCIRRAQAIDRQGVAQAYSSLAWLLMNVFGPVRLERMGLLCRGRGVRGGRSDR